MGYPKLGKHLGVAACAVALLLAAPAAAQADWGAIAVNPLTGATGVSYGYDTAAAAKKRARNECRGSKCRVAVWVRNGYGALVLKKNGAYVAGAGSSKAAAFRKARARAHEQGARKVASVFSGY